MVEKNYYERKDYGLYIISNNNKNCVNWIYIISIGIFSFGLDRALYYCRWQQWPSMGILSWKFPDRQTGWGCSLGAQLSGSFPFYFSGDSGVEWDRKLWSTCALHCILNYVNIDNYLGSLSLNLCMKLWSFTTKNSATIVNIKTLLFLKIWAPFFLFMPSWA